MVSDLRPEDSQNWSDNVFQSLPVGDDEERLTCQFLHGLDFSPNSRRAMRNDLRKFARWFWQANAERFSFQRVTVRDVADFRDCLRRNHGQAVASVNRCLVTLRRFFKWLVECGRIEANPAKSVKELRQQQLAPQGLARSDVRRLLREVELRQDIRSAAIFSLLLYTGCRVDDLVGLEMQDIALTERSGTAVFRLGKGGKQRTVPLPLPARKALQAYLNVRPLSEQAKVFVGERGPLTDRGVRALCDKYSAITGINLHPHLLRHTFAHQFLADSGNDLVALAQILGHENVNTTARYSKKSQSQLTEEISKITY